MATDIKIKVIPSRFNLFWWEAVVTYENSLIKSLGQFRSEEEAYSYIEYAYKEN